MCILSQLVNDLDIATFVLEIVLQISIAIPLLHQSIFIFIEHIIFFGCLFTFMYIKRYCFVKSKFSFKNQKYTKKYKKCQILL